MPTGPTSTNDQSGRRSASSPRRSRSILIAITAPTKTIRGRGSASSAGSRGAGRQRRREQLGVGDVRHQLDVRADCTQAIADRLRARDHEIRLRHEASTPPHRSSPSRSGREPRCRRRSGRRRAGAATARSAAPPAGRTPTDRAGRSPASASPGSPCGAGGTRSARRRTRLPCSGTTSGERTATLPVRRSGLSPRRSRRAMRRTSRADAVGLRSPSDSTKRTGVARRDARHEVVLVRPELGVPVGEARRTRPARPRGWAGSLARQEPFAMRLELLHRLLVVLVASDVHPVPVERIPPHRLAVGDEALDERRESRGRRRARRTSAPRARSSTRPC